MSIFARWDESNPGDTQKSLIARQFLSTFDLNIRYMTNRTIHILDYPAGENGFNQLKASFDVLLKQENISHTEMVSAIENEPAATLVFLFLSDPKDLSAKVDHLTTYTTSVFPTIWILLHEKYCPHTKEKNSSIWEPLTNAQYYEVRPTLKIMNEKWIGTKFTTGGQGLYDMIDETDIHMASPL